MPGGLASVQGPRRGPNMGPLGEIRLRPGRAEYASANRMSWNHLPAIIRAFPQALSEIVRETTEELGEVAAAFAPVQGQTHSISGLVGRPVHSGDPTPGTLRDSKKTSYFNRRGSDVVITGKVAFDAKDKRGHKYGRPVESGSIRRGRQGLYRVPARHFLIPAVVEMRPRFIGKIASLEEHLPR